MADTDLGILQAARTYIDHGVDAHDQALRCKDAIEQIKAAEIAVSRLRVALIRQLEAEGYTGGEIAAALGLSRQRVNQILGS